MSLYREEWPLLIVCPSSLKYCWRDEILKWLPRVTPKDIQLFKAGKEAFNFDCSVFIMSYDLATRKAEEIMKHEFKAAIADEAHYLKSRDAKRTKQLMPIFT